MRGGGKGEPKAGIEVDEGDDIPSGAVDVLLEGVEGHHMTWIASHQSVGLSQGFYPSERLNPSGARDTKRYHPETAEVDDEAADGLRLWTRETVLRTEGKEQRVELLLAEVRALVPQTLELFEDTGVPETAAGRLGCTGAWVESFELAPTFLQRPLPVEEGTLFDPVCFLDRLKSMLLPEVEYLCPLLCRFGDHIPEAYASLPHIQPALSSFQIASYSHAP